MRSENITRLKSSNDFRDSLSEGFKCAVVAISIGPPCKYKFLSIIPGVDAGKKWINKAGGRPGRVDLKVHLQEHDVTAV